mgnify:CR=1 FL=1
MSRHHDPDALLAGLYGWDAQGGGSESQQGLEGYEEPGQLQDELPGCMQQEELVDVPAEEAIRRIEEQVTLFLSCLTTGVQPDFFVVSMTRHGPAQTGPNRSFSESASCAGLAVLFMQALGSPAMTALG